MAVKRNNTVSIPPISDITCTPSAASNGRRNMTHCNIQTGTIAIQVHTKRRIGNFPFCRAVLSASTMRYGLRSWSSFSITSYAPAQIRIKGGQSAARSDLVLAQNPLESRFRYGSMKRAWLQYFRCQTKVDEERNGN